MATPTGCVCMVRLEAFTPNKLPLASLTNFIVYPLQLSYSMRVEFLMSKPNLRRQLSGGAAVSIYIDI